MSPLEKEVLQRKLSVIIENLEALEPVRNMSREEYIQDLYKRKAAERLLQELIEAAIDINTHIIVNAGGTIPDDYYTTFTGLRELKIIPSELAEKLAPSAGLRNRLVHEYDRLEHSLVLEAVKMAKTLYPEYIREISNYIKNLD